MATQTFVLGYRLGIGMILEQDQAGERSSGRAGLRALLCERGVTARGHPAERHDEHRNCEPNGWYEDQEHVSASFEVTWDPVWIAGLPVVSEYVP